MRYAIFAFSVLGLLLASPQHPLAQPSGMPRFTLLHMTANRQDPLQSGRYASECVGTVSTETMGARRGETVTWHIRHGNGFNNDDLCGTLDKSLVSLKFQEAIWAKNGTTTDTLPASGNKIEGIVDMSATMGKHKYQILYDSQVAGPDPEIDVECPSCGPGGGGPGGGGPGGN